MKKQVITTISTYPIRAAFLLILPFLLGPALGQGNAGNRSVTANLSQVAPSSTGAITGTYAVPAKPAPKLPAIRQSQFPTSTSDTAGAHSIILPPMPKAPQVVLYDQYNNASTTATLSATFTDFPTFSSDLADDFVVPAGQTWNVQSIDADGVYFNGAGPATSWNVFIYANSAGLPGMQIFSATNQPVTVVGTTYTVTLPVPAVLTAGTYWVEIQANMTFATQGEWGWTDRTVQSNNPAAWQDPGGGLGVCPTWMPKLANCVPTAGGPDQVFRLNGTIGGGGGCNGSKIYNIAGFNLSGQSSTTRIYDITSNTWTTGAPVPEAAGLSDHATGYSNGKIYVAGGYNGTGAINTLHIYDIASDSWTTGAPLPAALYLPGFGVINGKFYVASGNNGSTEVNTLYIYDIASNTWSTGPVVPTPVTAPGSAVYQGKLYLFGGGAPFPTTITTTQIYDPVANSWSTGPSMNVARLWFYGGAIDNTSVVAPGGDNPPGTEINDNEQLTASWTVKAPLPFVSRGPFAVSDGTVVYIGGGYDGSAVHADLLRYDPVANTYTPLAPSPDAHFLSQAVLVSCAPTAQSAFSRKVHGAAGTFDIPLPLTGNVGVECRIGPTYQMIINFATTVTVGSASVTSGTGTVSSFSGSGTSQITVNLSGVTDQQRITMTLHNVNNGTVTGDVPISMGVLAGDVNGNGAVSSADVALTKSQVGATVGGTNFREDVNVNGTISSTDVALVKSDVGHALPP